MTYEPNDPGDRGEDRQKWTDDVQSALDRTGDAVRAAWEATREGRMSALEAAKQAVKELGDVLEKGVGVAKERWAAAEGEGEKRQPAADPADPPSPAPSEEPPSDPTPPVPPPPPTP